MTDEQQFPYHPHAGAPQHLPPLAEWWERWLARLIDGVLFAIASSVVSALIFAVAGPMLLLAGSGFFDGLWLLYALSWVISGLGYAAYDYLMHARRGQTVGKLALGIRVATLDLRPVGQQALLRRAAAYPGVFALVGLAAGASWSAASLGMLLAVALSIADGVVIITDQRLRQSLHDRFAATIVVKAT